MRRREFLESSITVTAMLGFSGCLSTLRKQPIDLDVLNWTQESVELQISLSEPGSDDAAYEEEFDLDGNSVIEQEDVVPPGTYVVTVRSDGERVQDGRISTGNCEKQEITVIYHGRYGTDIEQNKC